MNHEPMSSRELERKLKAMSEELARACVRAACGAERDPYLGLLCPLDEHDWTRENADRWRAWLDHAEQSATESGLHFTAIMFAPWDPRNGDHCARIATGAEMVIDFS